MQHIQIQPVDVLHLRGNRLFADGGGDPLMPPWPSLFAGAIRSRMLADADAFDAFGQGKLDGSLAASLGRGPSDLGTFRVTHVSMCCTTNRNGSGVTNGEASTCVMPLPADVVVTGEGESMRVHRLVPEDLGQLGLKGSFAVPGRAAVLRGKEAQKPVSGLWLTWRGLGRYQRGGVPAVDEVVRADRIWSKDPRLGIALGTTSRTAREGLLYTSDAVVLTTGTAFVVGVEGADGCLPKDGLLRIGGDGRGADVKSIDFSTHEHKPWQVRPETDRFFMLLATPGVFPRGWLPPGVIRDAQGIVLQIGSLRARLMAAAVAGGEVVSGWDLHKHKPKTAQRIVPAGSVYWFEVLEGERKELQAVRREGLWALMEERHRDAARRAEGFNNVWFGDWNPQGVQPAEG